MGPPKASTSSAVAQATFELQNHITDITEDEVFRYDKAAQQAILNAQPWKADPNYFKKVRISAVALIKMVGLALCSNDACCNRGDAKVRNH